MDEKLNAILLKLDKLEADIVSLRENLNDNANIAANNFLKLEERLTKNIKEIIEENK